MKVILTGSFGMIGKGCSECINEGEVARHIPELLIIDPLKSVVCVCNILIFIIKHSSMKMNSINKFIAALQIATWILIQTLAFPLFSQTGVGINSTGAPPDGSAMLDVSSTNKGFLFPRVLKTIDVSSPAKGLIVYQMDYPEGLYINIGTSASPEWIHLRNMGYGLANRVTFWGAGNSLSYNNDFYWDNTNLRLGIGTAAPTQRLDVAGTTKTMSFQMTGGAGLHKVLVSDASGNASWTSLAPAQTNAWGTTGNSGTVDGTHFIGTLDYAPLNFKINNMKAGRIDFVGNTFFGFTAGLANTSGAENTAIGFNALQNNNSGKNTATGYESLYRNTTGAFNTAMGANSLSENLIGTGNTAVGSHALFFSTGHENVAVGRDALRGNGEGHGNVAIGNEALYRNNAGNSNVAIGRQSQYFTDGGYENTSAGLWSLYYNTSGLLNTATGSQALYLNNTGTLNTAYGARALLTNTTGHYNTALGFQADVASNNLSNATAVGAYATVSASNCLVLGNDANVGIGISNPTNKLEVVGNIKTTNMQMTNGAGAGKVLTSDINGNATWQTPSAVSTPWTYITGTPTTISGYGITDVSSYAPTLSGGGAVGTWGIDIGGNAATATTATNFAGSLTGDITGTQGATSISAGVIVNADINNSASIDRSKVAAGTINHVIINDGSGNLSSEVTLAVSRGGTGSSTQNFVDLSSTQTVGGDKTWSGLAYFNSNVGIGNPAPGNKLDVTALANNNSVVKIKNTQSNTVADGLYIQAGDNVNPGAWMARFLRPDGMDLGRIAQDGPNSVLYVTTSDARLKDIIGKSQKGLTDLMKINIYDYTYKNDANLKVRTGFLAQELYEVFPQSVLQPRDNGLVEDNSDTEHNPWMVDYGSITPLLVKAMQELNDKVEKLEKDNEELRAMMNELLKR